MLGVGCRRLSRYRSECCCRWRCPLPKASAQAVSHPSVSDQREGLPEPSGKAATRGVCRPRCARPEADGVRPSEIAVRRVVGRANLYRDAERAGEDGGLNISPAQPEGYCQALGKSGSGWGSARGTSIGAGRAGGGVSCGARPAGYVRKQLVPHAGDFDPTPSGSQRPAGLGPLEWLCHGPVEIGNEALDPLLQVLLRREAASP